MHRILRCTICNRIAKSFLNLFPYLFINCRFCKNLSFYFLNNFTCNRIANLFKKMWFINNAFITNHCNHISKLQRSCFHVSLTDRTRHRISTKPFFMILLFLPFCGWNKARNLTWKINLSTLTKTKFTGIRCNFFNSKIISSNSPVINVTRLCHGIFHIKPAVAGFFYMTMEFSSTINHNTLTLNFFGCRESIFLQHSCRHNNFKCGSWRVRNLNSTIQKRFCCIIYKFCVFNSSIIGTEDI